CIRAAAVNGVSRGQLRELAVRLPAQHRNAGRNRNDDRAGWLARAHVARLAPRTGGHASDEKSDDPDVHRVTVAYALHHPAVNRKTQTVALLPDGVSTCGPAAPDGAGTSARGAAAAFRTPPPSPRDPTSRTRSGWAPASDIARGTRARARPGPPRRTRRG